MSLNVAIENNQSHHHDVIASIFGVAANRAYEDIQYLGLTGSNATKDVEVHFVQEKLPDGKPVDKVSSMAIYKIVRN